MTRIIAGSAGGRRLLTPKGAATRPTSDRVREALFAALDAMLGTWEGLHVLDLYAGSGALGIEALSRGAASATLVESHRPTAQVISRNLTALSALGLAGLVRPMSVSVFLAQGPPDNRFDLVFCDPPYSRGEQQLAEDLRGLSEGGFLAADAVVVCERDKRSPMPTWPAGMEAGRMKRYGETVLWYGHADQAEEEP